MPRRPSGRPPRRPAARVDDLLYPSLDLHGESAESARRRATFWLRERRAEGTLTVRLITGVGRHSVGPPVLPAEMDDLLRQLQGSVVARFEREPGGGAFRVTLRPESAGAAPRRPAVPPNLSARLSDPDMRRRAEEALAELGVTPTPELLLAAIRRLREEEERGERGS